MATTGQASGLTTNRHTSQFPPRQPDYPCQYLPCTFSCLLDEMTDLFLNYRIVYCIKMNFESP
eukprot:m.770961 g.770961  ORF g.770961 m.770961 type:complete len:63 (-) comp59086_c0_seq13:1908-2096(-)